MEALTRNEFNVLYKLYNNPGERLTLDRPGLQRPLEENLAKRIEDGRCYITEAGAKFVEEYLRSIRTFSRSLKISWPAS